MHLSGSRQGQTMACHQLYKYERTVEPVHEISNKVVCVTSKASDQPAHARSLIRVFASRLSSR